MGRSVSPKGTAEAFAIRATIRLANPARAFCSATTNGIRRRIAPMPQGTLAYPPKVSTTLGRLDRSKEIAWKTAVISPHADARF